MAPRFMGRRILGLNYSGLSRGLKIFRDTVPLPCRPLPGTAGLLSAQDILKVESLLSFNNRDGGKLVSALFNGSSDETQKSIRIFHITDMG